MSSTTSNKTTMAPMIIHMFNDELFWVGTFDVGVAGGETFSVFACCVANVRYGAMALKLGYWVAICWNSCCALCQ